MEVKMDSEIPSSSRRTRLSLEPISSEEVVPACFLCNDNVQVKDGSSEEPPNSYERDCYMLLLESLGIEPDTFLEGVDDWSNLKFTYCQSCYDSVQKSFLLNEELKSIRKQLQLLRLNIGNLFSSVRLKNPPTVFEHSEKAKRRLVQCYQPCCVRIECCDSERSKKILSCKEQYSPVKKRAKVEIVRVIEPCETNGGDVIFKSDVHVPAAVKQDQYDQKHGGTIANEATGGPEYDDLYWESNDFEGPNSNPAQDSDDGDNCGVLAPLVEITEDTVNEPTVFKRKLRKSRYSCGNCNFAFENRNDLAKHSCNVETKRESQDDSESIQSADSCADGENQTDNDSDWELSGEEAPKKREALTRTRSRSRGKQVKRKGKRQNKKLLPRVLVDPTDLCLQSLPCPFCGLECSLKNLGEHTAASHGVHYSMGVYACCRCGDVVRAFFKDALPDFWKKHQDCNPVDEFKCIHCKEPLHSAEMVAQHYAKNHPWNRKCYMCGLVFASYSSVWHHLVKTMDFMSTDGTSLSAEGNCLSMEKKHNQSADDYVCVICHKRLRRGDKQHTKLHGYVATQGCLICTKCGQLQVRRGKEASEVKEFVQRHENCDLIPNAASTCMICKLRFGWPKEAAIHYIRNHHRGESLQCTACNETLPLLELVAHEQQAHQFQAKCINYRRVETSDPRNCPFCCLRYNSLEDLARHVQSHSKRKSIAEIMSELELQRQKALTMNVEILRNGTLQASNTAPQADSSASVTRQTKLSRPRRERRLKSDLSVNNSTSRPGKALYKRKNSQTRKTERKKTLSAQSTLESGSLSTEIDDGEGKCLLCGKMYDQSDPAPLIQHVLTDHNLSYCDGVYGCAKCSKLYLNDYNESISVFCSEHSPCEQNAHMISKCCKCKTEIESFQDLVIHAKSKHADFLQPWCHMCGFSFEDLQAHKREKHEVTDADGSEDDVLICELCDLEFPLNGIMFKRHLRWLHKITLARGLVYCAPCAEMFDESIENLQEFHMRHKACSSDSTRTVTCKTCNEVLNQRSVSSHLSWVHCKNVQKECYLCGHVDYFPNMAEHYLDVHKAGITRACLERLLYPKMWKPQKRKKEVGARVPPHKSKATADLLVCKVCDESFDPLYKCLFEGHVNGEHKLMYASYFDHEAYCCQQCEEFHINSIEAEVKRFAALHGPHCEKSIDAQQTRTCDSCESQFPSFQTYAAHMLKCGKKFKTVSCMICCAKFFNQSALDLHVKSHVNVEITKDTKLPSFKVNITKWYKPCPICGIPTHKTQAATKRSKNTVHFRSHLEEDHGITTHQSVFGCIRCWAVLDPASGMTLAQFAESHKTCDILPPGSNVRCDMCATAAKFIDRYYNSCELLLKHKRLVHFSIHFNNCTCEICGRHFTVKRDFLYHMRIHENPEIFKCPDPTCGKVFQHAYSLKCHMEAKKNRYVCDICGKDFMWKGDLKRHRDAHAQIRNIKCIMCDKMFWNKSNMRSHVREFHRKARRDRWQKKKAKLASLAAANMEPVPS